MSNQIRIESATTAATNGGDAAVGSRRRSLLILAAIGGLGVEVTEFEHEALVCGRYLERSKGVNS